MSDGQILPWVVILPLGAAIVTVLLPHAWRTAASMAAIAPQLLAAVLLLRDLVVLGPRTYALADHAAPLGAVHNY